MGSNVTDTSLGSGIAPRPAQAVVKQLKRFANVDPPDNRSLDRRCRAQIRGNGDQAIERICIMRCNHLPGERNVGEVLAIGIEFGVRQAGWTAKDKFFSGGGRRPALGQ